MSQVNLNRQIATDALSREKLGVFLRLRAHLWFAHRFAESATSHIQADLRHKTIGMSLDGLGANIDHFDFDEAWEKLHLFPQLEALKIANLRVNIRGLNGALKELGDIPIAPSQFTHVKEMLARVSQLTVELQDWLNKAIPKI